MYSSLPANTNGYGQNLGDISDIIGSIGTAAQNVIGSIRVPYYPTPTYPVPGQSIFPTIQQNPVPTFVIVAGLGLLAYMALSRKGRRG